MSLTGRTTTSRVQSMTLLSCRGDCTRGRSACGGGTAAADESRVTLAEVARGAQRNRASPAEDQAGRRRAGHDADRQEDHARDEAEDIGDAGEARADDEQHVGPFREAYKGRYVSKHDHE